MEGPHGLRVRFSQRTRGAEPTRRAGRGGASGISDSWFARHHGSVHVLALVLVAGCAAATWWQVGRALEGNGLSWVYVFEWPFFGGYAVFMWRRLLREAKGLPAWRVSPDSWLAVPAPTPAEEQAEAERLWAYNRYLGELALADTARRLARRRQLRAGAPGRLSSPSPAEVASSGPAEVASSGPAEVASSGPAEVASSGPAEVDSPSPAELES